jgi:hypothetical protein
VAGGRDSDALYQRWDGVIRSRILYTVSTTAEGVAVSLGQEAVGTYREITGAPSASQDGLHWGFLARGLDERWAVVVDGREVGRYGPFARAFDFRLGDAGRGWSFTAVPDAAAPETHYKILNGKRLGPFAYGDRTWFSADGQSFQYWARIAGKAGGNQLVFNGKVYGPWSFDHGPQIQDLERGRFGMVFRSKEGVFVRDSDKVHGPYQDVELIGRSWGVSAEHGPYFGFVAVLRDGRRELHVDGGKTYGPYRGINARGAWISADATDWLVGASGDGGRGEILIGPGGETETKGFDLRPLAGGYLLMLRKEGEESLQGPGWKSGPYSQVSQWRVSADGTTWLAEARRGEGPSSSSLILVNGREYPGEGLRYRLSPGAEYCLWLSRGEDGSASLFRLDLR